MFGCNELVNYHTANSNPRLPHSEAYASTRIKDHKGINGSMYRTSPRRASVSSPMLTAVCVRAIGAMVSLWSS